METDQSSKSISEFAAQELAAQEAQRAEEAQKTAEAKRVAEIAQRKADEARVRKEKAQALREHMKKHGYITVRKVESGGMTLYGRKTQTILTHHAPSPAIQEARAANAKAAQARVQAAAEREERAKARAAQLAKQRKAEDRAGRLDGIHARKGVTIEKELALKAHAFQPRQGQPDEKQAQDAQRAAQRAADQRAERDAQTERQAQAERLEQQRQQQAAKRAVGIGIAM